MAAGMSLKDEGNAAFAAARYQEAAELYTAALTADTVASDDLAALHSNRCAAFIHLFRYDLGAFSEFTPGVLLAKSRERSALLDADEAVKRRPTWSRAYARRAEVFSHLCEFDASEQQSLHFFDRARPANCLTDGADKMALQHAEDEDTKSRFRTALAAMKARKNAVNSFPDLIDYPKRIAELEKKGADFVEGGTAELVLAAYEWVEEGMKKIDEDVIGDKENGWSSKVPSGILTIAGKLQNLIFPFKD
jgi:tetratricopeptide (TPR) repeat protein